MHAADPDRAYRRLPLAARGWTMLAIVTLGGVGSAAAIGTYLWSLRVASVKAQADAVDGRIAATHEQIAGLRRELAWRTRLVQQGWWAPSLGLQTPDPFQYGRSGSQIRDIAAARRTDIAARTPLLLVAPAAPQRGYAPQARHALDTLIADIAR